MTLDGNNFHVALSERPSDTTIVFVMMTSTGFYDRTAEYVAVLLPAAWTGSDTALAAALDGLDTAAGPILDVGAGTGIGTAVIAAALPEAEILALEPNHALRTALLARVLADERLRGRVTVGDRDLLAADLPDRVSAAVLMNVIGHFAPPDRHRVWALLAQRLAPSGRAVLNLYPPARPESMPRTALSAVTVGRRRYTGSAAAEPAGPDAVTWTMTYHVEQDGARVGELVASDHWWVLGAEELAVEVAAHGLRATVGDPTHGISVISR